jgi:DNA-binding transcriptional ArsR family regulator
VVAEQRGWKEDDDAFAAGTVYAGDAGDTGDTADTDDAGDTCDAGDTADDESWESWTAARVDTALRAVANPVRRFLLELLVSGSAQAGDLAASAAAMFGISTSRASQHLQVLARAGLVDVDAYENVREYSLTDRGLDEVSAWIASLRLARAAGRESG